MKVLFTVGPVSFISSKTNLIKVNLGFKILCGSRYSKVFRGPWQCPRETVKEQLYKPWKHIHLQHIVPFAKFHRLAGAPPETYPNVKYDAPEEVSDNRKCFDSPIKKWGLVQIYHVNSSWGLTLCSFTVFCCP